MTSSSKHRTNRRTEREKHEKLIFQKKRLKNADLHKPVLTKIIL